MISDRDGASLRVLSRLSVKKTVEEKQCCVSRGSKSHQGSEHKQVSGKWGPFSFIFRNNTCLSVWLGCEKIGEVLDFPTHYQSHLAGRPLKLFQNKSFGG